MHKGQSMSENLEEITKSVEVVEQEIPTETNEQEVTEQTDEPVQKPSPKEENLSALRKEKERVARERDELAEKLRVYETARQQEQPTQAPQDEDFSIGEDDLVEGKHVKRLISKIKKLEEKVTNNYNAAQVTSIETRLNTQFSDFSSVVNEDTMSTFKELYPEVAKTLVSSPDLHSKAVSAYTLIKKLGIYQDPSPYNKDINKIKSNASKPRSSAAVAPQQGDSPLSMASEFSDGLTDDLKKKLYQDMIRCSKNI